MEAKYSRNKNMEINGLQGFETLHLRFRQNTKAGKAAMEVIRIVVLYEAIYIEKDIE